MSDTKREARQQDAPEVHVDTPEQAVARQMVDTNTRVTHVAREEEDVGDNPSAEAFSLAEPKVKKAGARSK